MVFDSRIAGRSSPWVPAPSAREGYGDFSARRVLGQVFSEDNLKGLSASRREEIRSLARERDPEMFFEGLLSLAGRMEQTGEIETAARVYAALSNPEGVHRRARQRLDAIRGVGASGPRAEFLLRRLSDEALDPAPLIGMGLAAGAFRLTRFMALTRMASGTSMGILPRWLGAKNAASLIAFGSEAVAFPLGTRLAATAMGREIEWSSTQVGREWASSFTVLGGMRLTGAGVSFVGGRLRGIPNNGFVSGAFRQMGMLGGIMAGHRLEQAVGLRPPIDGATTLIDSLALLLQTNVAGGLVHRALGSRLAQWEVGLENTIPRATSGERWATFPVRLATVSGVASPLPGPRPHFSEILAQPIRMSSLGKGEGPGKSESPSRPFPIPSETPLDNIRGTWVPRIRVKGAENVFSYEIRAEPVPFSSGFAKGRIIARRDGREMGLQLVEAGQADYRDSYFPKGTPYYYFRIREGEGQGELTIFESPEAIQLFSIRNFVHGAEPPLPKLAPGAGTVVMDWMASLAALRGKRFDVISIENPHVFEILQANRLIDTRGACLEGCWFEEGYGHGVDAEAPFREWPHFFENHHPHFVNVRAHPNPDLLPPGFRVFSLRREGRAVQGAKAFPFTLHLDPLQRFFQEGFRGPIAERDGRTIFLKTVSSGPAGPEDRFFGRDVHRLILELQEGEGRGKAALYLENGAFSGVNLETSTGTRPMAPGAGAIFMNWMATQAALHGLKYHSLYIKNPRILRILEQQGLIDTKATQARVGYWDWILGDSMDMGPPLPFDRLRLEAHFQRPAMMTPIVHVYASPHPGLISDLGNPSS